METYLVEFGAVALAHALAVASPGPDFALVLRQSLVHGRATAVASAVGIGTGILVHVSYSLLGVSALVWHQPSAFAFLKIVGAIYLAFLGVQALRSRPAQPAGAGGGEVLPPSRSAWLQGFLTNLLNPKATLFFLALFSVGVSPLTPLAVKLSYGVWLSLATMAWFSLVAVLFTRERVRAAYRRWALWVDRAMGIVFLGFALSLLWT